jgi:hypothetical protein
MICRAVCVGWKEIACAATQIADLAVYEDCATDGRTRDARLVQGLGIRAVLVDKTSLLSPSAYLTFCSSRDSLDERTTTCCPLKLWPDLLQKEVCPANGHDFITHQQTHLYKLSCFVFRLTVQ